MTQRRIAAMYRAHAKRTKKAILLFDHGPEFWASDGYSAYRVTEPDMDMGGRIRDRRGNDPTRQLTQVIGEAERTAAPAAYVGHKRLSNNRLDVAVLFVAPSEHAPCRRVHAQMSYLRAVGEVKKHRYTVSAENVILIRDKEDKLLGIVMALDSEKVRRDNGEG